MKVNPKDCIFAIQEMEVMGPKEWVLIITPKSFYVQNGYMYDGHLSFSPKMKISIGCLQEGVYDFDQSISPAQMHDMMCQEGLEWSRDLSDFLIDKGDKSLGMFIPDSNANVPVVAATREELVMASWVLVTEPTPCNASANPAHEVNRANLTEYLLHIDGVESPVKPSHEHTLIMFNILKGKLTTEIIKRVIVEIVNANPGGVAGCFGDDQGKKITDPKFDYEAKFVDNWKRHSKEKLTKTKWLRIFDCAPYEDQLRCYVESIGDKITGVSIVGE
jgi:hypothetical protein